MTFWRAAGLNYVHYSNIAAKMVRRSLKKDKQQDALKRDLSSIRFTEWKNGKPVSKSADGTPK